MRFTFDNNYFNARFQGIPIGGYTAMVEKMLERIEVKLGVDYLAEKSAWDRMAKTVVYTGPIGRAGQSVQEDVMKKRCAHQLKATELCFTACHLDELTDKRKRNYCRHELFIMFGISILYARLNGSEQAEDELRRLWTNCRAYDAKWADVFRYRTPLRAVCLPGKGDRRVVRLMYKLAYAVVRFN